MLSYHRIYAGHALTGVDGLLHGLIVVSGGYFLDDELEAACTGEREIRWNAPNNVVVEGVPNCLTCWKVMLL